MRAIMMAAAITVVTAGGAAADTGEYGAALRQILSEAAAGKCAPDLMAEPLLSACRDQMATMKPGLAALGTVSDVTFIKAEAQGETRVETYSVRYSGGKTTIWSLGNRQQGKFTIAYTLGQ